MRKIGAIIPVFSNMDTIGQFLKQISNLDKVIFLYQGKPWPDYVKQHGCVSSSDGTYEFIIKYAGIHPNIEIYTVNVPVEADWHRVDKLWNAGIPYVLDCDIVLKLDVDYFFSPDDWELLISYIRSTSNDCYYFDFRFPYVTNYYVTGSLEYGVNDSDGFQIIAFDPKSRLSYENIYPAKTPIEICKELPNIRLHHLRGWKPKYTQKFIESNFNNFCSAPQEIKNLFL